jgi:hypothetical protein
MDGANQREHLRIAQAFPVRRATAFPGMKSTGAHAQRRAQRRQRVGALLSVDPGVLHNASFAKFNISSSCFVILPNLLEDEISGEAQNRLPLSLANDCPSRARPL